MIAIPIFVGYLVAIFVMFWLATRHDRKMATRTMDGIAGGVKVCKCGHGLDRHYSGVAGDPICLQRRIDLGKSVPYEMTFCGCMRWRQR